MDPQTPPPPTHPPTHQTPTTTHRHIHDIQRHQICIEHQKLSTCVSEFCCLSGWNYPLAGLCQDLVSIHLLWLLFCKLLRGAVEVDQFRVWPTWEGAPCQVGTRLVKLTSLRSKSTCNFCCIWSSGCSFGCCIPVSSLQYLPIGKLLVMGLIPIGEFNEN